MSRILLFILIVALFYQENVEVENFTDERLTVCLQNLHRIGYVELMILYNENTYKIQVEYYSTYNENDRENF